jgi:hypothetical protein
MKVLEAQRFDVNEPLEERWDEILGWMTRWTAGKLAKELHLPEAIAAGFGSIASTMLRRTLPPRGPLLSMQSGTPASRPKRYSRATPTARRLRGLRRG